MAELTFYPDAHPETTSVDGFTDRNREGVGETWVTIRNGAGIDVDLSITTAEAVWFQGNSIYGDYWYHLGRGEFLFDISLIPAGAIVTAVTFSLYGSDKNDTASNNPNINIYSSSPASNTNLVAADHNIANFGNTPFSTTKNYADWSISGYNDFVFNADGVAFVQAALVAGGIVKLGTRDATHDVANSEPPNKPAGDNFFYLEAYTAEQGTVYRPKLVVTYTTDVGSSGSFTGGAGSYGGATKRKRPTTYQEDLAAAIRAGYEHPINKMIRLRKS